jgi:soluble lytic murein transglycosylase
MAVTAPSKRAFFILWMALSLVLLLSLYHQTAQGAHLLKNNGQAQLSTQRLQYQQTLSALKSGDTEQFSTLKAQLKNYPLLPYIEYQFLISNLKQLTNQDILAFSKAYADTPLRKGLLRRWYRHLIKHKRWQEFTEVYDPGIASSAIQCQHLWATYQLGDRKKALDQVPALWLVGHSQSKTCDKLFDTWIKAGRINETLAWKRFQLALIEGNGVLARYILRFMKNDPRLKTAKKALLLIENPGKLTKNLSIDSQSNYYSALIKRTLLKLARKSPDRAIALWEHYRSSLPFDQGEELQFRTKLGLKIANSADPSTDGRLARLDPLSESAELQALRIRYRLRERDWKGAEQLIDQLPSEAANSSRWRYWKARMHELNGHSETTSPALSNYEQLAQKRNFYGFMSADRLGLSYPLNNHSQQTDIVKMDRLQKNHGLVRSRELYYADQRIDARREWRLASRDFSAEEHYQAAKLARRWGWYAQSIRSAIAAKKWDDLMLRFPTPYNGQALENASRFNIDSDWILAIARQESAFTPDARSSAGAMGLMQLMPKTALQTAKAIKIKYHSTQQLKSVDTNMKLGSAYLAKMHERFQNNRVLASAAYNAGPHRVNRWLKQLDSAREQYPVDIWIETIPFKETRQYVQNVLSYAVIYSDLLGRSKQLFKPNERYISVQ